MIIYNKSDRLKFEDLVTFSSSVKRDLEALWAELESEYGQEAVRDENFELPAWFVEKFVPLDEMRQFELEDYLREVLENLRDIQAKEGTSKFIFTGTIEEVIQLLSASFFPLTDAVAFSSTGSANREDYDMRKVIVDLDMSQSQYRVVSYEDTPISFFGKFPHFFKNYFGFMPKIALNI